MFLPVWLLILVVLALGLGLMTSSWMGALSRRRTRHSGGAPVRPLHQPGGLVDDEHQAQ